MLNNSYNLTIAESDIHIKVGVLWQIFYLFANMFCSLFAVWFEGSDNSACHVTFAFNDVFPVNRMVFEGVEVAVPKNPDGVLKAMYGDYMKLPELEDRKPHFDKVVFL